jgi:hypothetical protein
MKKIISLSAFLCLFLLTSIAQDRKVSFGLQFSNGISFMNSDNVTIQPTKVGYAFDYGLLVDIHFTENYGLGTGLIIGQTIAARANTPAINNLNPAFLQANNFNYGDMETYKYTYVNLPTTFKLTTNDFGYFRFFGEFGVVNSFRVRSRFTAKESDLQNVNINKRGNLGELTSTLYNASLKVGGGFEYIISDKTAFVVGLSFQNGFVNVLKDGDDQKTVLRIVNLTTGIKF